MTGLRELQDLLVAALRRPDHAVPRELIRRVDADVAAPEGRIGIYRANVLGARMAALEKVFPVCRRILGERCFGAMARDFALLFPCRQRQPDALADGFADWMQPLVEQSASLAGLDYLPDLARLEWARHRAWFAADSAPFDFSGFAASLCEQPAQRHGFRLSDSFSLLQSAWPVDRVWEAHQDPDVEPIAQEHGPFYLGVQRASEMVGHWRMPASEYRLLRDLAGGQRLETLQARAAAQGMDLQDALQRWVRQGVISGFWV